MSPTPPTTDLPAIRDFVAWAVSLSPAHDEAAGPSIDRLSGQLAACLGPAGLVAIDRAIESISGTDSATGRFRMGDGSARTFGWPIRKQGRTY